MRLVEVPVMNLRPGMFVAELDRPWLDTPFAVQGFVVRDDDDVLFVSKHVDHVYVDVDYSGSNIYLPALPVTDAPATPQGLSLKADFDQAKLTFASATETLNEVFDSLHIGRQTDMNVVKKAVRPLISGVFQNREALAALARLKESGEYRYNHSLAMCVWAAILGRHVGLPKDQLEKLVTGCAMCDLGMTKLPHQVFDHPQELSGDERELIRNHTKLGAQLVQRSANVDLEVVMIIETHHERHDGSGYPVGLSGSQIPLLARIAGLVDTYDAMISARPHAAARSSFDATQELLDAKDRLFQGALVEQFVQAIGLFPVSALVELNTGEIAIVVTQNETRRLKPEVLVVLEATLEKKSAYELLDLADSGLTGAQARWIVRELPPGSHGIDSQDFFI